MAEYRKVAGSPVRRRGTGTGVITVLMPALVAGCNFAPDHVRPALPVPETFPTASMEDSVADGAVARIGWRAFFRDRTLQALIDEALAGNRDLRIAAGRVEEARAAFRIQGAALYPQLAGTATGTRARVPADLSVTGAPVIGNEIYAQFTAGWEVDFWGRLRNLRDAARAQYLATGEARRAIATGLVTQVAVGYLLEREYEERIALARRTIDTREDSLRILRRRYEVGSGSKLEMTQAQTLLAQARTALQALEQDREVNRNALALLVGKPVAIAPAPLGLAGVEADAALPTGLPADLLTNRPDIVAAEHALRAANANIGAARAAFFPNINLTGGFGTASAELDGLFEGGSRSWNFTPTTSLPIFTGGRNVAGLDLAEARRTIAVADYERTVQAAFRDVSDALVQRRQLAAQIGSMRDMLQALTEQARLAQLRFDSGRSTYLEVLDAQRDLFETGQTLVRLRGAHLASGVALYAALGGGFADSAAVAAPQSSEEQPE